MATKKPVTTDPAQEDAAEKVATAPDPKEGWVEVFLHKDNNKYKKDLFVGINGKRYLVKRGEPVMVPPEVAEAIRNSQRQDVITMQTIEKFRKPVVVDQM